MDSYALGVALAVKPIDTLFELLDQNQNDPDVRELRSYVVEDRFGAEGGGPDDPRLRNILELYQKIMEAEVDLLSGRGSGTLRAQVAGIAEQAEGFFNRVRELIEENKSKPRPAETGVPAKDSSQEGGQPLQNDGPQRITEETMRQYRREKRLI